VFCFTSVVLKLTQRGVLQKSRSSVDSESSEYRNFEQLWEKKHKSERQSSDLPKFGASDFKFISVLGKGSFGKVRAKFRSIIKFLDCRCTTVTVVYKGRKFISVITVRISICRLM